MCLGKFRIYLEEVLNLSDRFIRLYLTNIGNYSLVCCSPFDNDKTLQRHLIHIISLPEGFAANTSLSAKIITIIASYLQ